ncbi:MAG: electron transfer flavoprotein subunit alpha/FixB family protein [SAR202 cluster bacterium]|jgi:electron transfer flavoprotein alpha subunit|nr:electron transfer flavoprotein subunit alpha/FixB family protein [SAR202 cluster bacterium]MDP6512829.1 electron transfer flavoprotein subunit alpha/FixB family protein [SAR202 cluster bacterium]MDP6715818.1 electron transfer flavoprotein subunit alpha/FixB family protein [SAR202 cluster bacterium]
MAGILILGEIEDGALGSITGELATAGRSLAAASGDEVAVALLGDSPEGLANDAIAAGADKVYTVADPLLGDGQSDAYLAAFHQVCQQTSPSVVLIGKTELGRDLGPRLAFRLGVAVAQDCVDLSVDESTGRISAVRPVYGGNAMARVTFQGDDVQIAVVRPKTTEAAEPDAGRTGDIQALSVELDSSVIKSRRTDTVTQAAEGVRLEDATVVVGGGRGMGGEEPFGTLAGLASTLGGAMGASRAACDAGWLDHSYQVGLTGKTITPDLYITVAISGASQHMAGCSGAKHVIAINRDQDANIFKSCSYGVVGDWNNVLPAFIETVNELINS